MNAKENYLECIRFGRPEYVPMGNEPISWGFQFDGNFKMENWTDSWGVGWEVGLAGTVPFPKANPLPTLDRLADLRRPSPGDLVCTDAMKHGLAEARSKGQLVGGNLTYLLVERAWAIMGMENFMVSFLTHGAEMKEYLHSIAAYARGVFDRYLELGVDMIGFSEDLGTQRALMMSPRHVPRVHPAGIPLLLRERPAGGQDHQFPQLWMRA